MTHIPPGLRPALEAPDIALSCMVLFRKSEDLLPLNSAEALSLLLSYISGAA
jgi:hypothetical protein